VPRSARPCRSQGTASTLAPIRTAPAILPFGPWRPRGHQSGWPDHGTSGVTQEHRGTRNPPKRNPRPGCASGFSLSRKDYGCWPDFLACLPRKHCAISAFETIRMAAFGIRGAAAHWPRPGFEAGQKIHPHRKLPNPAIDRLLAGWAELEVRANWKQRDFFRCWCTSGGN